MDLRGMRGLRGLCHAIFPGDVVFSRAHMTRVRGVGKNGSAPTPHTPHTPQVEAERRHWGDGFDDQNTRLAGATAC